ncbi:MAG: hypothetical protein GWO00_16930, partial [Gemmatimonadetes bacterium]|nr:hypothetical protein [Gemmatimonadota bacterium]NIR79980.1 hypothetical protein [Gemmatimonadota bacterium]NIT88711.1 hypothetical protein [Gemmatimonadota bacterium]NIU32518.1 hypothetical protein [Gemmatimonadota bacterium]NIV62879.1 hypothetical protein [Gemmatimonadota bacterium]
LLTTAAGLVIAVPVNIVYNFFVTRIDKLIVDMEQGAQQILNLAWDMEKEGKLDVVSKRASLDRPGAPRAEIGQATRAPDAGPGVEPTGSRIAEEDPVDMGE